MSLIDVVIICMVIAGTVMGFIKGFLWQLASVLGLVLGLVAARALYVSVAEKLCPAITDSMTAAQVISFVGIWILVPIIFTLVASFFTHALEAVSLGWLNRLLGLALGTLKWILIIGLFINVLDYVDDNDSVISKTKKEESALYYPIKNFVSSLFPTAKEITNEYTLTDAARRTQ